MPEAESTSPLEAYVLLANGAKGAAAVGLVQQVLEASTVYVFGELWITQTSKIWKLIRALPMERDISTS